MRSVPRRAGRVHRLHTRAVLCPLSAFASPLPPGACVHDRSGALAGVAESWLRLLGTGYLTSTVFYIRCSTQTYTSTHTEKITIFSYEAIADPSFARSADLL